MLYLLRNAEYFFTEGRNDATEIYESHKKNVYSKLKKYTQLLTNEIDDYYIDLLVLDGLVADYAYSEGYKQFLYIIINKPRCFSVYLDIEHVRNKIINFKKNKKYREQEMHLKQKYKIYDNKINECISLLESINNNKNIFLFYMGASDCYYLIKKQCRKNKYIETLIDKIGMELFASLRA